MHLCIETADFTAEINNTTGGVRYLCVLGGGVVFMLCSVYYISCIGFSRQSSHTQQRNRVKKKFCVLCVEFHHYHPIHSFDDNNR